MLKTLTKDGESDIYGDVSCEPNVARSIFLFVSLIYVFCTHLLIPGIWRFPSSSRASQECRVQRTIDFPFVSAWDDVFL